MPVDGTGYAQGDSAVVLEPGTMARTGFRFSSWNTMPDGNGTSYMSGDSITVSDSHIRLHAQWAVAYQVIYKGNQSTGGTVPVDLNYYLPGELVTIAEPGDLNRTGYGFDSWNTDPDGLGTEYLPGETVTMPSENLELYAQWVNYRIIYYGNDNDGGSVPVDNNSYGPGDSVTIAGPGDMTKSGYNFIWWEGYEGQDVTIYDQGQTITMPEQDLELYARWSSPSGGATTDTTGSLSFQLRHVSAGHYYVGNQTGNYDYSGNTNVSIIHGFWIAETEVTYALWYEVYSWAISNGYTFANPGREGNDGTDGNAPTIAQNEPVTMVNWRDAMLWCNAISEKEGLTPVYYTDSGLTTPIRSVTNSSSNDTSPGAQDNPYVNWDATGYRLPTEVEYEIAARGADMSGTYGTTYPGSNTVTDVAWYYDYSSNPDNRTKDVGSLSPNELNLYDMAGNAKEWSFDWFGDSYPSSDIDPSGPSGSTGGDARSCRGGSWFFEPYWCEVSSRDGIDHYIPEDYVGFRVVRTGE